MHVIKWKKPIWKAYAHVYSNIKGNTQIYIGGNSLTFQWLGLSFHCRRHRVDPRPGNWWGFPCSSVGKESAFSARDLSSIPQLGKSPREGNGNPLQYSCLENPTDRGIWQATVHGVARVRHNLVTKPPPAPPPGNWDPASHVTWPKQQAKNK